MDQGGRSGPRIGSRLRATAALALVLYAYRLLLRLPEDTLLGNFEAWLFEPGAQVVLPVLLGAAWLLVQRLRSVLELPPQNSPILAAVCLASSSALYTWSVLSGSWPLLLPSLATLGLGFASLWAGMPGCRALALPFLFLLVAFPIPEPLRHEVVWVQQEATASISASFLGWLGVPAYSEGIMIHRPGMLFIVIESCSGFRFATAFASIGLLLGGLARQGVPRLLLMMFTGIGMGLLLNEIRVLWIVLTSSSWAASSDHALQGLVAMAVGVPLLMAFQRLVSRVPAPTPGTPERRAPDGADRDAERPGWAPALAVTGLFAALALLLPPATAQRAPALDLSAISGAQGDWRSFLLPTDFVLLGSVGFDQVLRRGYRHRDGTALELFIGSEGGQDPSESPFSPVTELPETGWVVLERESAEISGRPAQRLVLGGRGARALAYTWRVGDSGLLWETLRATIGLPLGVVDSPQRRTVVRVSAALALEGPADRARAEARLRDFVATFLGEFNAASGG